MKGYVPVVGYLHVEPIFEHQQVVGAKISKITQRPTKEGGLSVKVTLQIPLAALGPLEAVPVEVSFGEGEWAVPLEAQVD